ncbi:MAG: YifB family Mg chelatase-like AAA ATPase [Phycisphaeraceae bacterium]|nr:YifB family Mg chelatase-like AAA ATPase [Phycisphaeraceae bacterium]
MIARVQSFLLQGIEAHPCEVEVDLNEAVGTGSEQARAVVVGLPDAAVKESFERMRAAIENSGYAFPMGRVVINLAPADVRKEGPLYDLPIAIGVLMSAGVLSGTSTRRAYSGAGAAGRARSGAGGSGVDAAGDGDEKFEFDPRQYLFAGELALDGRLRPVRGVIAMATLAAAKGAKGVVVPHENVSEAALVPGIEAIGVRTLTEVVGIIAGDIEARPAPAVDVAAMLATAAASVDFGDVRGQEAVKRAIVVAAAGGHNVLMLGPAGTGKTMMARALPGVLPPLTVDEAIEITRIYSAAGQLPEGQGLVTARPVRSPHHTASSAAIVGGGAVPKPGEISLAHRGVLFLDELPEFPRIVLETLRQPLEDHVVTIARSHSAVRFPASFMLVCAMNPTPKGDMPTSEVSRGAMERYLSRLSGPLIDRIDIHIEAPAVSWKHLSGEARGTSSAQMREQALRARERQIARQGAGTTNARLSGRQLDSMAAIDEPTRVMLGRAMTELGLSARAYDKVRRVARTIADLAGSEAVSAAHVTEAISYRLLDRKV